MQLSKHNIYFCHVCNKVVFMEIEKDEWQEPELGMLKLRCPECNILSYLYDCCLCGETFLSGVRETTMSCQICNNCQQSNMNYYCQACHDFKPFRTTPISIDIVSCVTCGNIYFRPTVAKAGPKRESTRRLEVL